MKDMIDVCLEELLLLCTWCWLCEVLKDYDEFVDDFVFVGSCAAPCARAQWLVLHCMRVVIKSIS